MSELKKLMECGMRQSMHNGNNALQEFQNGNLSRGKLCEILIKNSCVDNYIDSLETGKDAEIESLKEELALYKNELSNWETVEKALCPKNVGIEEFVEKLEAENDRLKERLEFVLEDCDIDDFEEKFKEWKDESTT